MRETQKYAQYELDIISLFHVHLPAAAAAASAEPIFVQGYCMMNVFMRALRENTMEMSIEQKTIHGNVKIVCFSNQSNVIYFPTSFRIHKS